MQEDQDELPQFSPVQDPEGLVGTLGVMYSHLDSLNSHLFALHGLYFQVMLVVVGACAAAMRKIFIATTPSFSLKTLISAAAIVSLLALTGIIFCKLRKVVSLETAAAGNFGVIELRKEIEASARESEGRVQADYLTDRLFESIGCYSKRQVAMKWVFELVLLAVVVSVILFFLTEF